MDLSPESLVPIIGGSIAFAISVWNWIQEKRRASITRAAQTHAVQSPVDQLGQLRAEMIERIHVGLIETRVQVEWIARDHHEIHRKLDGIHHGVRALGEKIDGR